MTNTGEKEGQETVELYTRDWYASIVPAVKRLRRFEKITLESHESKKVSFTLTKEDVSFVNAELKTVFEAGDFDIIVHGLKKSVYWK